eukprot:g33810.t1
MADSFNSADYYDENGVYLGPAWCQFCGHGPLQQGKEFFEHVTEQCVKSCILRDQSSHVSFAHELLRRKKREQ